MLFIVTRVIGTLIVAIIFLVASFAQADSVSESLERARVFASTGNNKEALEIISPLAAGGNAKAQHFLAIMLAVGQGVQKDQPASVKWWTLAAEQDFREAQYRLGMAHAGGLGVREDKIEGLKWMIIARTEETLGYELLSKTMKEIDILKARSLAKSWRDSYNSKRVNTATLSSNEETQVLALSELAAEGIADAQYELGLLHSRGVPLGLRKQRDIFGLIDYEPDHQMAMELYRKAADQGHTRAQVALASSLRRGIGAAVDVSEAAKWYVKASEQGHIDAQEALAEMYLHGEGVAKDPIRALDLYEKSAAQGNPYAMRSLGEIYSNGSDVPVDSQLGYMWLLLASNKFRADIGETKFVRETEAARSAISELMSLDQIDRAKQLAGRCKARSYRQCSEYGFLTWLRSLFE